MKVLFITSSRIGDAVLSTGLLDYIAREYPAAKVTIVCGPLAASLFEGYPALDRVITLRKRPFNRHWAELWAQVAGVSWDIVVDLRNSVVSRVVLARSRYIHGRHIDAVRHKVEQNAAVMKLDHVPAPRLWFSEEQSARALALVPFDGPILAVGPTANWLAKTWPAERFTEIVDFITGPDGPLEGARVAVFAAPGEEAAAQQVLGAVPSGRAIDVIARADPGTAAAAVARCDLYIGNDSGLMHCAAAVGVPTLGLFGPSWPHLYRPWGRHADYIATPSDFAQLTGYEGYDPKAAPCLMTSLTTAAVKNKVQSFWNDIRAG